MMEEKQSKVLKIIMAAILLVSMYFVAGEGAAYVNSDKVEEEKEEAEKNGGKAEKRDFCVVIDAGHGGADPGKVGVNGSLEKEINLKIAEMVKAFLETEGVEVVMTRTDDHGLYDDDASNKKVQDMKRRIAIIEEAHPQIVVSIHQNSYHEEYVHGAQVFYYAGSEESKELAQRIQQVMTIDLDPDNTRQAKANDSYYLLKKTSSPIVIVECGFLSNYEEAQKLSSDIYQEKAAWAIHLAILQHLNDQERR